ncbi:MAG: Ig-like domain-containing protein [Vicinamibacterales bacterium]
MTRVTCEGVSRRVARGVVYVLIPFMLSACGNDNTTTPTPTLQGLTVTCAAATLSVFGASTQCAASVRLSNGQTQDQTSTATWSSSNTAIATVSGGLVRAVAQGSATITATYQGLTSTAAVTVDVPLTGNIVFSFAKSGSGSSWRMVGTIDVTLNRPITPAPALVRVEMENSLAGAAVAYGSTGGTLLHVDINQTFSSCPVTGNTPPDFVRITDVDRQAVVLRLSAPWSVNTNPCP